VRFLGILIKEKEQEGGEEENGQKQIKKAIFPFRRGGAAARARRLGRRRR